MSNEARAQRLRLLVVAGVVAPVLMATAGWLLPYLLGRRPPNLLVPVRLTDLVVGLAAGLLSMALVSVLYRLHPALERALRRSGVKVGMEALEVAGYPVMLLIVTAAAFGEEMLFRGGLQPLIGLVPAALLFGFSHGGWRREMWAYVVAASLSGIIFGLVLRVTGNIWAPIAAHVVHNVLSTALMGRKFDVTWDGWLPRVQLVPDPRDYEEVFAEAEDAPAEEPTEVAEDDLDKPILPESDSPQSGADDGDSADRRPE